MILNPNAASVLVVPHGRPAAATNHHGSLPPPHSSSLLDSCAITHSLPVGGWGWIERHHKKGQGAHFDDNDDGAPPPQNLRCHQETEFSPTGHTQSTPSRRTSGRSSDLDQARAGHWGSHDGVAAWVDPWGMHCVCPAVQAREGGRRRASCLERFCAQLWWSSSRNEHTTRGGRFRRRV